MRGSGRTRGPFTTVVGSRSSRQVAFVGPFGVGKTTAVSTLCGSAVTSTEVRSSRLRVSSGHRIKPTTTVGLEIGHWTAPDGRTVNVVGTPGQERFDTVRQSAMPRSNGVVIWLFGNHRFALSDLEVWLDAISAEVPAHRITLAVTRLEEAAEGMDLGMFELVAHNRVTDLPVVAADPRSVDDVADVVRLALRLPTNPLLEETPA